MRCATISLIVITLLLAPYVAFAQNVEYVGSYDSLQDAWRVFVSGNYAFVVDHFSALQIVEVSNPVNPTLMASYAADARDIFISGSYGYLASGSLEIIDISDIANPSLFGSFQPGGPTYDVFVSGNYAFLGATWFIPVPPMGGFSLSIVNISDPSSPFSVWEQAYTVMPGPDICFSGEYLIFSDPSPAGPELGIYDISDPAVPEFVGGCITEYVQEVTAAGNYVYAAGFSFGLLIIDISDPANPVFADSCDTPGAANTVFVSGNNVFVAGDSGLAVIDVTDPTNPMMVGFYDTPRTANDLFVCGDYIYIADGPSLQILRFTPTGIEDNAKLPGDFSLSRNYPNPFNAQTTIQYSLPKSQDVTIDIFDILGRKIETLAEGMMPAGNHQAIWDASNQSSGIYFYRIKAGNYSERRKMILIK